MFSQESRISIAYDFAALVTVAHDDMDDQLSESSSAAELQQTVLVAYRSDTGEAIYARDLLTMSEDKFVNLRRRATLTKVRPEEGPTIFFLRCGVCNMHLYLTRRGRSQGGPNRFFAHARPSPECPWYVPSRFTKDQIRALRFHGQKEGQEHLGLKALVARSLSRDSDVAGVVVDKVQLGEVLKGEWKKPDVRCTWRNRPLVFELQVSYTFITEVVKRDSFYQAEGKFIIWIFARSEPDRAIVLDEEYFNRRNLFVLDDAARQECEFRDRLVLTCWHTVPHLNTNSLTISDERINTLVELRDLIYSEDDFRPFYFDYKAARDACELERSRLIDERKVVAKKSITKSPGEVVEPIASDDEQKACASFLCELTNCGDAARAYSAHQTDRLYQAAGYLTKTSIRHVALASLSYPRFQALLRLQSIVLARPLITAFATVYQIINSVLQKSASLQRQFAYFYVEAWDIYRPSMRLHQVKYMEAQRSAIEAAMKDGYSDYSVDMDFALLVAYLYPQMEPAVARLFMTNDKLGAQRNFKKFPVWTAHNQLIREERTAVGLYYVERHPEADWRKIYKSVKEVWHEGSSVSDALLKLEAEYDVSIIKMMMFLLDMKFIIMLK